MNENNLMIIAGEVSGDLHGAHLIIEILKMNPAVRIFGIGGDKMQAAGMQAAYHINKMSFLGLTEIIKHLPFIKRVQKDLLSIIKEKNIKEVVLIDYPGFNLNFARKLKKLDIKIFYYISPQIWAWGAGRIKKIKKLVSKMIVVFPFEKEFYSKAGVDVEFVGHPLIEQIENYSLLSKEMFFHQYELDSSKDILLILPGSRKNEVDNLLPETLKAAKKICGEFNLQAVVAGSENIDAESYSRHQNEFEFKLITGKTYDLMNLAKFGIIKSGTSTLEAGLFQLPMIVIYKTSAITYLIFKRLVKVNNIGMVNIISGEEVVPELIQNAVNAKTIFEESKKILSDIGLYNQIKNKLGRIKTLLGSSGASRRAASIIISRLNES
jgi:lipid-A-disaccharide synthase